MLRSVGLPISHKENENRRALVPEDINQIKNVERIYIESGYGDMLGYCDNDYAKAGIRVATREEVLKKDIICDPKIGDAEYLGTLHNQIIFGWMHAVQNKDITDKIINSKLTAYAWEDMYYCGKHCFWRNNEIAGEAAVSHAYLCHGIFPYNTKVAVLGNGNTARGALKMLSYMGAEIVTYGRKSEELFRKEIGEYDVVVNAIMWDTSRHDHIIYRSDLSRMKRGSMIIDISCDKCGAIESSEPTTIENPTYIIDGVRHYVVDHTPSLYFKTTSKSLSAEFVKYIDFLIKNEVCPVLQKCEIIKKGIILDERINQFQKR
jgi:N5-(carboxyethyl)ornithine synthase